MTITSPLVTAALTPADADRYLTGGVNSANRRIGPRFVAVGSEGAEFSVADGRTFVDYHAGFGPLLLGHRHPRVDDAVFRTLQRLDLIGAGVTDVEIEAARRVVEAVPSAEKVVFTNSGSEATYSAIRLARAVTGRRKLIKFQGCYHGWHDAVALNVITPSAGMGAHDPLSAGSSAAELGDTVVCRFNDLGSVEAALATHDGDVAAVIVEPIPHNIGAVLPLPGFLAGLRSLTQKHGAILIFDEVITGVRHGLGGFQAVEDVMPDLTCLGKAVANGYPAAAIAGPEALMSEFGTAGGPVFLAGTFNGHPASMAAVTATLDLLKEPGHYEHMFALGARMRAELQQIAGSHGHTAYVSGYGSVFVLYFLADRPDSYDDLLRNDDRLFVAFQEKMIDRGHYVFPQSLKRSHISLAHTTAHVDRFLEDADVVLEELARDAV